MSFLLGNHQWQRNLSKGNIFPFIQQLRNTDSVVWENQQNVSPMLIILIIIPVLKDYRNPSERDMKAIFQCINWC